MSRSNSPKRRRRQKELEGRGQAHRAEKPTCLFSGKNCYGSRKAALTELNRLRANPSDMYGLIDGQPTAPTAIYKCQCSKWHLTSSKLRT